MILSLRRRHRRMFAVLGVLLPLAFAAGLAARKPVPAAAALPRELATPAPATAADWERTDLFMRFPVQVRRLRAAAGEPPALALRATDPQFARPDLLVYWLPHAPAASGELPADAILLGAFAAAALPLPPVAAAEGVLALYSLADQELVAVSVPFQLPPARDQLK